MIPILFEKNATTFTTNGLGRLADCISCIVTEERNGVFECEFEYPVTGAMFDEIRIGRIIVCTHDEDGDVQPFDIYKTSEPINGVVTFYAQHISYRLNEIVTKPFRASSCSDAIAAMKTNSIGSNPFTFNTNKAVSAAYEVAAPTAIRPLLGGEENSLLDVYGSGEYDFDKFSVYLYTNRGIDTDVSIRYGKNLADYTDEVDYSECYNAAAPYWAGTVQDEETGGETDVYVSLPEGYVSSGYDLPNGRTVIIPMDLSSAFEDQPTVAALRAAATSRLAASYGWIPKQNITVNFVQLWQTEEYAQYASLQRVRLCDTVLVDVPMYGVSGLRIKVIRVTWNVLLDRYDEIELGSPQTTLAGAISESTGVAGQIEQLTHSIATSRTIAGNTNQHFWFTSEGTDTGAHITEVDRETFLDDPANGGGNLLARSNGVAVRNGLTELATFAADSIRMSDGTRVLYEVASSNGAVKFTRIYNQQECSETVRLGRTVDHWDSIVVNFTVDGTADSNTYDSLPIEDYSETSKIGVDITMTGDTLDIFVGEGNGLAETEGLLVKNIVFNFQTTQQTIESTIGAYADKTLSGPFRIGNGTSTSDEENAFFVDWSGDGHFAGDVYANSESDSSGGLCLSRVDLVGGYGYEDSGGDYSITLEAYKVGHLVTLELEGYDFRSIASGENVFNVNVTSSGIPKPASSWANGIGYYGNHAIVLALYYNSQNDTLNFIARNAGSTAVTATELHGSITYITEE